MPHEGYADPVMNNGFGFHSNIPVNKLTEARHSSHRGKWRQLNPSGCGNHGWGDAGNHATDPDRPLVSQGLELPGPYLGTRLTAQVAVRTDMGEHPDRKKHKSP